MGSMDSAFRENFEAKFEPDDFYESFLAPKFHDFTAPEEPIDPDAYFMAKPGMLKEAFAVEEVKTVAPKIHKVAALEAPKSAAVSQQQAPPKSPVAAEKAAVSAGSAKKATRVVSTLLTPLASKSLKNGSSATNSPAQPPMLEKPDNGSLKPTSLVRKLQASENDDPNSPPINSPDSTPSKAVKPALTRQRSLKAPEDKPALTRQRSQKLLEAKPMAVVADGHSVQKASGDSCEVKSNFEKESDLAKAADKGTPQRKENSKSVVASTGGAGVMKANSSALVMCKTPVKEPVSNQQEVKKPASYTEVAASPYSGHHCKSSRCAANDPNFSSPVPTKKYLIAKRGTPGSLRKATPNHAVAEKCNEEVSSENPGQSEDEALKNDEGRNRPVEEVHMDAGKVKGHSKVALEEVFQKMALDQSNAVVQQMTKQVTVPEVTELSKSEVEDLKEVPLGEDRSIAVPAQSISAADVRAWAGRSVNFEDKASSSSEGTATDTEQSTNVESKTTGIDLFLQVASDCLENIDLNKLDLSKSKQGKKRKSGELMPAGASKRANCASDDIRNKAISKKISQVKDAAASKIPNKLKMRRLSVARRLSIARTNSRVTNPRPFRLRTQERGAVKEKEFIKKVEEYKASKEGFHSAFQGLAVAEPKIPAKFLKSGHVFSAKRADPKTKDDKEAESKALKPPTHKAPLFDHPFKPHRSTKKLTVPQEPKFHTARGSRTCPSHVAVPA